MKENIWKLEGKTARSVWASEDQQSLAFLCDGEHGVRWDADGDCCSVSWFADIVGLRALIGATVSRVEEIDLETLGYRTDDGRGRQECDQAYGFKIITDKGWVDVIFRNSSNGYYGGSMSAGVFDQAQAEHTLEGWEQIIDDWSADDARAHESQSIASWIASREERELGIEAGEKANGRAIRSL